MVREPTRAETVCRADIIQAALFSYQTLEDRIAAPYPLRRLRVAVDAPLATMDAQFNSPDDPVRRQSYRRDAAGGDHGSKLFGGEQPRLAPARARFRCPQLPIRNESDCALAVDRQRLELDTLGTLNGRAVRLAAAHRHHECAGPIDGAVRGGAGAVGRWRAADDKGAAMDVAS